MTTQLSRRAWLSAALASPAAFAAQPQSIGLIADIQYADQPTAGARAYRDSLTKLAACTNWFRARKPSAVVQLGDLIDGGEPNLAPAVRAFKAAGPVCYSVLGNHDATLPRTVLSAALSLREPWSNHAAGDWRLILLDAADASTLAGALHPEEGRALLDAARAAKASHAHPWNGGLGREQMAWLTRTLDATRAARKRALVFCHQPVLAAACRPEHLLLNHAEVLACLEKSGAVAAYFCGHDHRGGYAHKNGIHHVTLKGLVENPPEECATVVDLLPTALRLRTLGGQERSLAL